MSTLSVTDFQKVTESVKPFNHDSIVEVDFDLTDSLFDDAVDDDISMLLTKAHPAARLDPEYMRTFLRIYLTVLLGMRIDYVRQERIPLRPEEPEYTIPPFFSLILSQVGRVTASVEHGYTIIPSNRNPNYWDVVGSANFGIDLTSVEGRARWLRMASHEVRRWFNVSHVQYADAMTKSREGSLDLMLMHIAGQEVLSRDGKAHPVFALAAAIVGVHQRFTCALYATSYGTFEMLRGSLRKVTDLEGRHGTDS